MLATTERRRFMLLNQLQRSRHVKSMSQNVRLMNLCDKLENSGTERSAKLFVLLSGYVTGA